MDSKTLFSWMALNGVKTGQMAPKLKISPRTLSGYKSKGLPQDKKSLAKKVMDEWFSDSQPIHIVKVNVIEATPTPSQRRRWESNGLIKGNEFSEFALSRLDALADAVAEVSIIHTTEAKALYPYYGCMAAGQPAETQIVDESLMAPSNLDSSTHAIFEVCGQSAEPQFMDGDNWLVELSPERHTAKKGVPAVFQDENGCYLKIYNGRKAPFTSVNPDHPDVYPGQSLKLVGYPVEKI